MGSSAPDGGSFRTRVELCFVEVCNRRQDNIDNHGFRGFQHVLEIPSTGEGGRLHAQRHCLHRGVFFSHLATTSCSASSQQNAPLLFPEKGNSLCRFDDLGIR